MKIFHVIQNFSLLLIRICADMESILQKALPLTETIHHHKHHPVEKINSPQAVEKKATEASKQLNTLVSKSSQPPKPTISESPKPSSPSSIKDTFSNPTISLTSLTTNQKFARALHMIESERLRIREFLKVSICFCFVFFHH
jgi:hypothetical protein